jgi:hypothetical protein
VAMESALLIKRDGTESPCNAEIHRYAQPTRLLRAGVVAGGFLLAGAASIVIPTVHLLSTWLLPLIGFGIAYYVYKVETKVGAVSGNCPDCAADIQIDSAGTIDADPLWLRCGTCNLPLEFRC